MLALWTAAAAFVASPLRAPVLGPRARIFCAAAVSDEKYDTLQTTYDEAKELTDQLSKKKAPKPKPIPLFDIRSNLSLQKERAVQEQLSFRAT